MLPLSTQIHSMIIPNLISLVVTTAIGILILLRVKFIKSTRHFIMAIILNEFYVICVLLNSSLISANQIYFIADFQYVLELIIPLALLAFAIEYSGKRFLHPVIGWSIVFIFLAILIIPVLMEWKGGSGWVEMQSKSIQSTPVPHLGFYWIGYIFELSILAIGLSLLSSMLSWTQQKHNSQTISIMIGLGIPFFAILLNLLGYRFISDQNYSAYAYPTGYLIIAIGLMKFGVFNIKPVARNHVMEQMEDGVLVLDQNRQIVDINPAARCFLNIGTKDVIGMHFNELSLVWGEQRIDFSKNDQELVFQDKKNVENSARYIHLSITSLVDNLSSHTGLLLMIRDITNQKLRQFEIQSAYHQLEKQVEDRTQDLSDLITRLEEEIQERQQVEKALRINETKYHAIIEQASEPILIMDREGLVVETNSAFSKLIGRENHSLIGRPLSEVAAEVVDMSAMQPDKHRLTIDKLLEAVGSGNAIGRETPEELVIRKPDNSYRDIEFTVSTIRNEFGNMLVLMGRDISDSKLADLALKESEERYRLVVETSPNGIFLMDLDAVMIKANQFQAELFGYAFSQDLNGLKLLDFISEEDRLRITLEDRDTRWETTSDVEMVFKRKDGTTFIGEFRSTVIHDSNNMPVAVVGIVRDITLRKQIEQDLIRLNRSLKVLSECNQTVLRVSDENILLDEICRVIVEQGGYQFVWIGLVEEAMNQTISPSSYFGDSCFDLEENRLICMHAWACLPEEIRNFNSKEPLAITELSEFIECQGCCRDLDEAGITSIFVIPLFREETHYGGLVIYSTGNKEMVESEMIILRELTDDLSYGIQSLRMRSERDKVLDLLELSNLELSSAYDSTLEGWSHALELREQETAGHSQRVVDLSLKLARRMGIPEEELVHIRRGALLHDIGKMAIPDNILLKPGKLTEEEWVVMRQHPVYSYKLISNIQYLQPAIDIPFAHHERWDGCGYPNGLKEEEIPLAARIFAVVDVWDALRSDRPYRAAWQPMDVLAYIKDLRGKQFDPNVLDAFIPLIEQEYNLIGLTA